MILAAALGRVADAAADLALGSVCAGCAAPGRALCRGCRHDLHAGAALVTVVPGLPEVGLAAVARYGGAMRSMIIDHKERGRLALAAPLGDALAIAVTELLGSAAGCPRCGHRPVALVPAPSTRAAVRARGHDPLARCARRAAATLRRAGQDASAVSALRHRRRVADQAGLSHRAREVNLHLSLTVATASPALLRGRCVVLVDDIVTSGATLREGVRSLRAVGVRPCGVAVLAKAG